MRIEYFDYEFNGDIYKVTLVRKSQRNINYRLKEDGFHISAPYLASMKKIMDALNKFAPKLIKKYKTNTSHYSFEEDYIFVLGKKYSISGLGIQNNEELQDFLKKTALVTIKDLVRKYEAIMGINRPYKVGIRKTSTRYGSNSLNTHALSFQLDLIHFSEKIISTVVVHELAHEFYRNHQQEFYNCVYKYCPYYDEEQKKLKKGIHE